MQIMKKLLLVYISLASSTAFSQIEYSSFTATGRGGATTFVTDYQAVGINPANLGYKSKFDNQHFTMGTNEITYSIHSDALTRDELRNEFKSMIQNKSTKSFTADEKRAAAKDFTNSGFAFNVDYGSFGFAYNSEKLGGIAFRINDNINWYSRFNETTSDLIFMGKAASYFDNLLYVDSVTNDTTVISNYQNMSQDSLNNVVGGFASIPSKISQLFSSGQGTEMSVSWTREYNLSFGRKIIEKDSVFAVYAGIGVKYLQGMGYIDIHTENGELVAFSSITPSFNIDYGKDAMSNPSYIPYDSTSLLPKAVGNGYGLDLGANLLLFNKLKIGLAVTNIGKMTWTGNVYSVKDQLVDSSDATGINSYNLVSEMGNILGNEGLFQYNGVKEKTVALPTTVRLGASMQLGKIVHLGVDAILPTTDVPGIGSFQKAIIGFGGDIQPIPWLRLSAGFLTGGNYSYSIPVGLTLIAKNGSYEAGIASRDAVTFFTQNGPTLSLSTGFMRFRF